MSRLLEARDLFVNQALITGEPFPVEKHAAQATDALQSLFLARRLHNVLQPGVGIIARP